MRRTRTISLVVIGFSLLCFIASPGLLPAGISGGTLLLAEGALPQQQTEGTTGRGISESTLLRSRNMRQRQTAPLPAPAIRNAVRPAPRTHIHTTLPPPPECRPSSPRAPPPVS
ncbi:MAG: hypothetical protein RRA94_06550 [Bacteroidota bacterium]|nr:hypothetical protein [Bacteroidota bacterium]